MSVDSRLGAEEAVADTDAFGDAILVSEDLAVLRTRELDALAAILPPERRDRMAEILSDDDVATLTHLAKQGTGANTLRALASDLNYLERWAAAASGSPLPWPASEAVVLKFIAHHLYDPVERAANPAHGMPRPVVEALRQAGCLRTDGPHAPSTVQRRLALWSTLHRWRGLEAPFALPGIRAAMRLAVKAAVRPRQRKSPQAVTRDILDQLLATTGASPFVDARDRALLLVAFASGGRRRCEIARLRIEDIETRTPVLPISPPDAEDGALPCLSLRLGRTKTAAAQSDQRVLLIGRPVAALQIWLSLAGVRKGPVFRAIDRLDRMEDRPLSPQSVNMIVKKRCALAGLDPALFSAHGLRSGYMTEAARCGVSLQEAMQQSRHRSVQQAAEYYHEIDLARGRAARLG